MNIIKLQNELKGVPDQALIGYVQNPTGHVPTYLALSELQRRKEMRNNYQAAKPETTVAENLINEAQPQPMQQGIAAMAPQPAPMPQAPVEPMPMPQDPMAPPQGMAQGGLAELDVGNMYDEANYATGGIVAFDDGGEVQHYAEGGTSKIGDFFRNLGNPAALQIDKQIGALEAEKNKIKMDIFSSYSQEEKAMQQQRLSAIDAQIADLTTQRKGGAPNTSSTIPGANVMGSQAAANKMTGTQYDPSQALNIKSPAMKPPLAADGTDPYALEKVKGIGDYAKELKDYIGADPMRAKLQERMDKMDATAAKQADQAPWMALAQAGFGMAAGRSPNALLNIAEGAGAGLKDYASAKEKLNALEEKRFGLLADIARQDRAETIAVAKFGADSKQAIEERNAKAKLQQAHDRVLMKMNTEDNAVKLAGASVKGALEAKDILKYKTDFRSSHPDYLAWQQEMIDKKGKKVVNTPEFKQASEALLNQLIARDASVSTPAAGKATFLGFE